MHWQLALAYDIDYEETLGNGAPFKLDLTLYGLLLGYIFD
jgi:hypothetical protein